jgi:dihydrolipoamide dehydrogenase
MQIADLPIFIAGDANGEAAILHEAVDEGHIAGFNAARDKAHCFRRRVPMAITFTDPNIAAVGRTYRKLEGEDFVIGRYDFSTQSRARMSGANKGLLQIYVGKKEGAVLGAEMAAPAGEHLAHLLAMAIDRKMTVFDLLTLPFYHPTIEEGLRTATREASKKLSCSPKETDLLLCRSTPEDFLC